MKTIAIELNDESLSEEIKNLDKENIYSINSNAFDGSGGAITLIVVATPILIREISKIIQKAIESNRSAKVSYRGVEIRGVSEETLLKILELDKPNSQRTDSNEK